MPERWVVNASPLIVLAKINHQHLLTQLTDEIIVPQAVLIEINAGPLYDPARQFFKTAPLPTVVVPPDPIILAWDLGAGETAVLSYAYGNSGWKAVIDDGAARRCAHALANPLLGTLGIIIRARQAGLIPAAVPVLKALQSEGFRIDERVIRTVLSQTVGETWE